METKVMKYSEWLNKTKSQTIKGSGTGNNTLGDSTIKEFIKANNIVRLSKKIYIDDKYSVYILVGNEFKKQETYNIANLLTLLRKNKIAYPKYDFAGHISIHRPGAKQHPEMEQVMSYEDGSIYIIKPIWKYDGRLWVWYNAERTKGLQLSNRRYFRFEHKNRRTTEHRVLAETWLQDSYFDGAEVDHIDNDGLNNNINNLRWVTRQENMQKYWNSDNVGTRKAISMMDLKEKTILTFESTKEAAEYFNVSPSNISIAKKYKSGIFKKRYKFLKGDYR